jgi:hypothetical protein
VVALAGLMGRGSGRTMALLVGATATFAGADAVKGGVRPAHHVEAVGHDPGTGKPGSDRWRWGSSGSIETTSIALRTSSESPRR